MWCRIRVKPDPPRGEVDEANNGKGKKKQKKVLSTVHACIQ